jgi:hypothetical protein
MASPGTKGTSIGDEVLCVGLLGVFSVSVGDRIVAEDAWRLRKARTLIKLLALAPERRLHVEQAAELLWAERDRDSARNNLHQAIFAARRALDSIGLDGSRYLGLREELILLGPSKSSRPRRANGATPALIARPSRALTPSCCRRTATRTGAGSGAIPLLSSVSPWRPSWLSWSRTPGPTGQVRVGPSCRCS